MTNRETNTSQPLRAWECLWRSKTLMKRWRVIHKHHLHHHHKSQVRVCVCVSPTGDNVSTVRLRRTFHLHLSHTWRTPDLSALQLLQVLPVCWRNAGEEESCNKLTLTVTHREARFSRGLLGRLSVALMSVWWCYVAESSPGHPGRWTHKQLCRDRRQRQADGAATQSETAGGAGGPDPEGAELSKGQYPEPRLGSGQRLGTSCVCVFVLPVPGGAFPPDQRKHEPASPLVVHRPNHHTGGHRHLADETPQELLWGQKAGVKLLCVCV